MTSTRPHFFNQAKDMQEKDVFALRAARMESDIRRLQQEKHNMENALITREKVFKPVRLALTRRTHVILIFGACTKIEFRIVRR